MLLLLLIVSCLAQRTFQQIRFEGIVGDDVEDKYSQQPIDHFDLTNTKKIGIRYFLNESFYQKDVNAPLFVDLGGEGTQKQAALQGRFVINDYAEKYHSLMVAIEHRFYGKSLPSDGLTQENLGYLSDVQAIEDFVNIIIDIKTEYGIKGPVVVIGGSYSGCLSTWMRQKYPNVVHAAISSSAPIYATTDFTSFMDVIANDMGEKCAHAWGNATEQLEEMYKTEDGKKKIYEMFGTCSEFKNDRDFSNFLQKIQETFIYYPQYNGRYSLTIDGVCEILTKDNQTEVENLADFMKIAFKEIGYECAPSNYDLGLEKLANVKGEFEGNNIANTRSWLWQICTEYSFFQGILPNQSFSQRLTKDFYYQVCEDVFNVSKASLDKRVDHNNMIFGGFEPKATNVAYTSGSVDPWNPLAKHETGKNDLDCYASHIQGTAHCADIYAKKDSDPEQLIKQRQETFDFIAEILKGYKN